MSKEKREQNPYNICIWGDVSQCRGCNLRDKLKCHFDLKKEFFYFTLPFLIFFIFSIIGMIITGYGWYTLGWIGFIIFFIYFPGWEIRVLCSHCPYYAEKGRILHCPVNYGSPKLWKYHPEPMSKFEKIQFIAGFIIIFGYPFPFLILHGAYIFILISAGTLIITLLSLQKYSCSRCINFSCPFNRVSIDTINEFLKRNYVIKKAWEERGWKISEVHKS